MNLKHGRRQHFIDGPPRMTYQDSFSQFELTMPHAQRAFDLLVRHVEQHTPLPPDQ